MTPRPSAASRRPDSAQLRRQWALLRLLADSGRFYTAKELADQLDCSKATVQRDLATLGQEFALVEEQVGKQKKQYRIDQKIKALEAISFGAMELLALHGALKALEPLAGTPFYADLKSATQKIRGFLATKHNGGLDALAKVFLPHRRGYVDYENCSDVIDELVDAIAQHRPCRMVYRAAEKEAREHIIHPFFLIWYRGALYLFCRFSKRREISRIAVHRIDSLEKTPGRFSPPRSELESVALRSFGIYDKPEEEEEVEIRFSPAIAWRIEERIWHPEEKKARLPDGRLQFCIRTSAKWEIMSWVLGWGGDAELVSPVAWRGELAKRASAAQTAHG